MRKIFLDTDVKVVPGITHHSVLNNASVYSVDKENLCRIPMLRSLLSIRDDQWEIRFNDENDEVVSIEDDDINEMIEDVCTT